MIQPTLLNRIPQHFAKNQYLITCIEPILQSIITKWDIEIAEFWIVNASNQNIHLVSTQRKNKESQNLFKFKDPKTRMQLNEGLPGKVWAHKKELIWDQINTHKDFVRGISKHSKPALSALGIPLIFEDQFLGVILLGSTQNGTYLKQLYNNIAPHIQILAVEVFKKRNEEDLFRFVNGSPLLICSTNPQGEILKANLTLCNTFEKTEKELMGCSLNTFVNTEVSEPISFKDVYNSTEYRLKKEYITQVVTHSGKILWLQWEFRVNRDFESIYATAKDITEQLSLKELLNNASELAKIGAWEIDLIQNKITWSKTVYEIHEVDYATFIPSWEKGFTFYREDFRSSIINLTQSAITEGQPFEFEAPIITALGNEKWVKAVGKTVFVKGVCCRIYGSFQDITRIKEPELRITSLYNNLPGVAYQFYLFKNGSQILKNVSNGAKEIWGFSSKECEENNEIILDRIREMGEYEEMMQSIHKAIQNQSDWHHRWKYLHPDGRIRWHEGWGSFRTLQDQTAVFQSMVFDITQSQTHLEYLNQTSRNAQIGSWEVLYDSNQKAFGFFWSEMLKEMLGVGTHYNPNAQQGFEFLNPKDTEWVQKFLFLQPGQTLRREEDVQIMAPNQTIKWVRFRAEKIFIQGKIRKTIGSLQDITKIKEAEFTLSEILARVSDAFYALDNNYTILYFNSKAEELLNVKAEQVVGKNLWSMFPSARNTPLEKLYSNVKENLGKETLEYFFPGDKRWYEITAYGSQTGISVYFKNIDERKRSQQAIELQNKKLRDIAWQQSHTVRAPLARILALIDLLEYDEQLDPETAELMGLIKNAALELDTIIQDIVKQTEILDL